MLWCNRVSATDPRLIDREVSLDGPLLDFQRLRIVAIPLNNICDPCDVDTFDLIRVGYQKQASITDLQSRIALDRHRAEVSLA